MKNRNLFLQSRGWLAGTRALFYLLFFFASTQVLVAQQPQAGEAKKPAPYTESEKSQAKELVTKSEEDALKWVALADSKSLSEGTCLALKEMSNASLRSDPARSLKICHVTEAIATRSNFAILAADARLCAAISTLNQGKAEESVDVYSQAIGMYIKAEAPASKIAMARNSRAIAFLRIGDLQAAITENREALRLAREAGDQVEEARAQNGLGNEYVTQSNFADAEAALSEALRLARLQGEKLGESYVLNNLAKLHMAQGDFQLATTLLEQCLAIKRQIGNKPALETTLVNLSNTYHEAGDDKKAIAALDELTNIAREINDKEHLAQAIGQRGFIELDNHNPVAALKYFEEANQIGADAEDQSGHAQNLSNMAEAYVQLKQYENALEYAQKAAEIQRRIGDYLELSRSTLVEGEAYIALQQSAKAREALKESVAAVERVRNNLAGGVESRQRFMAGHADRYRLLAYVSALESDWPAALDAAEKSKARTLLDLYSVAGREAPNTLSRGERIREEALRTHYLSLDLESDHLMTRKDVDPAIKTALDANLTLAKSQLLAFREDLYTRHPELRLRRVDLTILSLKELATLVPDSSTALLEYELSEQGSFLFVIQHGDADKPKITGYKISASLAEISRRVRRFHEQLATRDPDFATEARWLYKVLLAPAQSQLKGVTSLVLVPDAVLWEIPFQALEKSDGHFLIENASLVSIPSLAVLRALESTEQNATTPRRLLALGNPGGVTQEQADETLALGKLYGSQHSETYLGKAATLERFKESAPQFEIVHIAAHGIFNDREPLSSHMLLAASSGKPEAGWLQASEIQSLQLKAELVDFSGCETGKGSLEDGEGLVGMSWAAMAAGAHSTLASAWRVEASSTTQLMLGVHRNLLNGKTKAESLRLAELQLLKNSRYSHPFYWASFVLIGDGLR